jgi:hypothetical protein
MNEALAFSDEDYAELFRIERIAESGGGAGHPC